MTSKVALITGAAGFIGSTLAERLLADGWDEVIGIDCFTDYYPSSIKRSNLSVLLRDSRFKLLELDINCIADRYAELQRVSHIFHQAGQPGVRKSWGAEFHHYTHANVSGSQALLEFARHLPRLQAFVYASSSSVYGNAETFPTTELALPQPVSPYGVSKLAAEHLMGVYAANFGLPTRSLRYFTVYGPRQRPDMAFTKFLTATLQDEPLEVFGDGRQVRDFTFVDDIVEANVRLAQASDIEPGIVLNAAGGSSVSVREVIDTIERVTGRGVAVRYGPPVPGDVQRTGGSTDAIRKHLDWQPSVSLEDGLSRQWQWIQDFSEAYYG
jgi:nucleoside-diphosphate-sugar epimerase